MYRCISKTLKIYMTVHGIYYEKLFNLYLLQETKYILNFLKLRRKIYK